MRQFSSAIRARYVGRLVLLGVLISHAHAQPSISGVVVDASGHAVSGATVYYNNVRPVSPTGQSIGVAVSSSIKSDSNGRFTISGVPLGHYYVCASGTQPTQLRSCDWGLPLATAALTDASATAPLTLTLGDGCLLRMTIEDPNGRIKDLPVDLPTGKPTWNLSFGVMSGGRYEPARLVSVAGAVRTYYVAVPKNSTFSLVMTTDLLPTKAAANATMRTAGADVTIDLGTVQ